MRLLVQNIQQKNNRLELEKLGKSRYVNQCADTNNQLHTHIEPAKLDISLIKTLLILG